MASFFHSYDLRGKFPDEIGEKEARRVGKAYGTFVGDRVLVGRDGRNHSEEVADAFVEGVRSTGTDVVDAGKVPTPIIYYGSAEYDFDSAAVVTASHNPPEYTGFKFTKQDALAMSREGGMARIEEIYDSGDFEEGSGSLQTLDLKQEYVEFVSERFDAEGIEVAVNYGNGAASIIGTELFEALGCRVNEINEELDGDFPNHLPAPGEEEAQRQLREAMDGEDLGVIFDGDGDRAGFIIDGEYVQEDEVLALFSQKTLEDKKGRVAHDLRASKLVKETIEISGVTAVETRVGHTFISEEIHSDPEVVFAGELSGHYYFPAIGAPWDDGLIAAAFMASLVASGEASEALGGYPEYPVSPELRIDCPEEAKQPVVEAVAEGYSDHETSTVDGVKIYFESGWALVRPSNTEEKMSVRCEADTEEDLEAILEEVESEVRDQIKRHS